MRSQKRQGIRRVVGLVTLLSFPVIMNWFSPYLSIWAASEGIIAGSVMTFAALFLTSTVAGRAFCGWVCPLGALMDIARPARERRVPKGHWIKYIIWIPWIVILVLNLVRGFEGWNPRPLFQMEGGVSVSAPAHYLMFAMVLLIVLVLALTIGRRAACHTICWLAPFMVAGRWLGNALRIPGLRIRSHPESCTSCRKCVEACPMSIDVNELVLSGKMEHKDCALCGACVDTCPHGTIGYHFGRPA